MSGGDNRRPSVGKVIDDRGAQGASFKGVGARSEFVEKYQEGPQTPELGVTCSGGTGEPIA